MKVNEKKRKVNEKKKVWNHFKINEQESLKFKKEWLQ